MTKKSTKFTHTGELLGGLHPESRHYVETVELRKTGKNWIDNKNRRYDSKTGYRNDVAWGLVYLNIKSIQKKNSSE